MDIHDAPTMYEKVIHEDFEKSEQIRLTVATFRGVEYMSLRKYYLDFDEEWRATPHGVSFPISFHNSRELFSALVEVLSLAESREEVMKHFGDLFEKLDE